MRCNEKTGRLVAAMNVKDGDELMLITKGGIIIRINTSDVSEQGRMTQGVTLINLDEDDQVMDVARVMTKEEEPASARNTAQQVPDDSVAPAQLGLKQEIDDTAEEARQISLLLERAEADTKDQNN